jgi:hypothetical protein
MTENESLKLLQFSFCLHFPILRDVLMVHVQTRIFNITSAVAAIVDALRTFQLFKLFLLNTYKNRNGRRKKDPDDFVLTRLKIFCSSFYCF